MVPLTKHRHDPSQSPLIVSVPRGVLTRRSSKDALNAPVGVEIATHWRKSVRRRKSVARPKGLLCIHMFWGIFWAACCILLVVIGVGVHRRPRIERLQLSAPNLVLHYPNATLVAWDLGPEDTMVQVIQTRFMQFQPNLAALGKARLNIFETFCLPSILAQSSKQFIWLIRTDPHLDANLRFRLINLLKKHPNILLIASNGNPEGFRLGASVEDITPDSVWSGSYELLRRYHAASQSRVLVESRLDADDGLHFGFVEFSGLLTKEELVSPETDWLVYCAYSHLEWHHANPFQKSAVKEMAYGFVVGATQTSCVTAGLSYVYGLQVHRDDMPKGAHSHLHKTVPLCSSSIKSSCLRRTKELIPTAIRARTPTSAGMANVVVTGSNGKDTNLEYSPSEDAVTFQDDIWKGVNHAFGIEKAKVAKTRAFLLKHLPAIVRDNLKGQCTKGHSCKPTSKDVLKQLLGSLPLKR